MKKTITIIIIIFLILLGGIGYYLYINNENQNINSGNIFDNVKNFFPFGTPSNPTPPPTQTNSGTTTPNTNNSVLKIDKMFQISNVPTAGYVTIDKISTSTQISFNKEKNATTSTSTKITNTFVRFVERSTGHILESTLSNLEKVKISNTTIPKVYEAYLNSKGTDLITRTLSGENIITEYRKIDSGTSSTAVSTSDPIAFPPNTDIVITKGDSVFFTTKSTDGSTGYVSTFDNKKPTQIFTTPLREIGASWSGGNFLEIFSKPNSGQGGVSFVIDTKNKSIKESLSNMLGLTTNINTDGSHSLYNTKIEDLGLGAKIANSNTAIYLTTKTLPEKCVWSKKNTKIAYCAIPRYFEKSEYPERWYQGVVNFSDDFWSVNVETGAQNLIYRPTADGKKAPDAISLALNEKENYLFFIDKNDLTLWGLSI